MNKHAAIRVLPLVLLALSAREASAYMPETEPVDAVNWAPDPERYFLVGIAFERGDDSIYGEDLLGDQLIGAAVTYRYRDVGVGFRLLVSPKLERSSLLELRGQLGLDVRYYFTLGLDWSAGLGVSGEARLADHFWLAYVNLLEVGVTLHETPSFSARLFAGVRYAADGNLVNWFLVDPNGFDNEIARDRLDDEIGAPFEGFVRIVFQRRIE